MCSNTAKPGSVYLSSVNDKNLLPEPRASNVYLYLKMKVLRGVAVVLGLISNEAETVKFVLRVAL